MATTAELLPWYGLAKQGRVFTGNIAAAGVILPVYTNTAQQVGLWNPYGNTKDLIVKNIALTYVSGTGAAGGFAIGYLGNAPAAIGTGLAITAFTETAAVAGYGSTGNLAQTATFGQGATLTVTAPALLRQLGLNQTVLTAATTGSPQWTASFDFEGDLVVTPGSAIFVAGNIATLSTFSGSITWAEVDRI
jgi:hypothetical protein